MCLWTASSIHSSRHEVKQPVSSLKNSLSVNLYFSFFLLSIFKKVAMKLFEQRLSYVKIQPKSQTKVSLLRLNLEHWLLYFFLFSSPR